MPRSPDLKTLAARYREGMLSRGVARDPCSGRGHCNWCGGTWPHWDYLIAHGLWSYGYKREASRIADCLAACSSAEKGLSEWYDAETGEGHGMNPFFAGASVLGVFLPVELACGMDPTRIVSARASPDMRRLRRLLDISTNRAADR